MGLVVELGGCGGGGYLSCGGGCSLGVLDMEKPEE